MSKSRLRLRAPKVVAALLFVVIFGSMSVLAQPGPRGFARHEPGPGFRLERILGTLSLTSDQRAAIDKIFAARRDSDRTDMESFVRAQMALRDQVNAEPFDEQAIRQAAAAAAALESDRAVAEAKMLSDVRAVLSDDQRTQLQAALKRPAWEGMRPPAEP